MKYKLKLMIYYTLFHIFAIWFSLVIVGDPNIVLGFIITLFMSIAIVHLDDRDDENDV